MVSMPDTTSLGLLITVVAYLGSQEAPCAGDLDQTQDLSGPSSR